MSTRNAPAIHSFHHLQSLRPFQSTPRSGSIQLRFSVSRHVKGGIEFSFTMSGDAREDFAPLVIPELKAPADRERKDELWKHTCLEVFVGPEDGTGYLEMNLSPSGDWNVYAFKTYREGMRAAELGSVLDRGPMMSCESSVLGNALTWKGHLLPSGAASGDVDRLLQTPSLVMGATAVLEYQSGEREYWALAHAGPKPDFHLRKSFRLKL